jgi:hypothetical protein
LQILSACLWLYLSIKQSAWAIVYCHMWPVWLYHILPHDRLNGTIFRKKVIEHKMCFWFSIQLLSEKFLILRRNQWATITNVHKSSCKVPIILSDFNETWVVSKDFWKILKHQISWQSIQWEQSCSMWTYRQKERHTNRHDKANSHFLHSVNTPKTSHLLRGEVRK